MLSLILILFCSLFFTGILIRTKSIASGRKGPGILQPVRDVIRLFKKGSVYSETTSIIFRIAPSVYFASVLMACLVIPFGPYKGIVSFNGDFIFFAYILALGKFFTIISAMDTGSSFEGMGASREALYSMFPKTHLELTMIHEVMVLDNSGFDLGLILTAGYIKFAMYGAIISGFFISGFSLPWAISVFILIQALFAVVAGIIESFMARFRMSHNPQFILALSSVSFLIFLGVLLVLEKFV